MKKTLTEQLQENQDREQAEITRKKTLKNLVLCRLVLANTSMITGYGPMSELSSKLNLMIDEVSNHKHDEQIEAIDDGSWNKVKEILGIPELA